MLIVALLHYSHAAFECLVGMIRRTVCGGAPKLLSPKKSTMQVPYLRQRSKWSGQIPIATVAQPVRSFWQLQQAHGRRRCTADNAICRGLVTTACARKEFSGVWSSLDSPPTASANNSPSSHRLLPEGILCDVESAYRQRSGLDSFSGIPGHV